MKNANRAQNSFFFKLVQKIEWHILNSPIPLKQDIVNDNKEQVSIFLRDRNFIQGIM